MIKDFREDGNIARLIILGSLIIAIVLGVITALHDICTYNFLHSRCYVVIIFVLYILFTYAILRKGHVQAAQWLLLIFYSAIATISLLFWGLNSPFSILLTSFVIMLPSILFGPERILTVTIIVVGILFGVQTVHSLGIIDPHTTEISTEASYWDVAVYIVIFSIFALLSWLSGSRIQKMLRRALDAEQTMRRQKNSISQELEKESARLRENQLKEVKQLYRFAMLGQTTAATLHELSNHLSVLNMDIDDLKQQHENSEAIANAKESIDHITVMLRQVRRKLDNYNDAQYFKPHTVALEVLKDLRHKFEIKHVLLTEHIRLERKNIRLKGDPLAWSQVLTILLTNALDACQNLPNAEILIEVHSEDNRLVLKVSDNGLGVTPALVASLFHPHLSSKPDGMGVGLYIAKHLVENQLNGTIAYHDSPTIDNLTDINHGASFIVAIPYTMSEQVHR